MKYKIIALVSLLLTGCSSVKEVLKVDRPPNGWGKIEGSVKTEWHKHGRDMVLLEDVKYIAPNGVEWVAHKGDTINGASIPKVFWSIIGGPYEGEYRWASVFHDVGCDKKERSWKEVHYMFYTAMRANRVPEKKAKLMYAAVYKYGPRWKQLSKHISIPIAVPIPSEESKKELEQILEK